MDSKITKSSIINNFDNNIELIPLKKLAILERGLSSYYTRNKEDLESSLDDNKNLKLTPIINIKNIQNGEINIDSIDYINLKITNSTINSMIRPGDVILSVRGPTFKAAVATNSVNNYLISNNLILIKLNGKILPEFLSAYLNSPQGQKLLQSIAAGSTTMEAINIKSLSEILIPVPDISHQEILKNYFILNQEHLKLLNKELVIRQKLTFAILSKYLYSHSMNCPVESSDIANLRGN